MLISRKAGLLFTAPLLLLGSLVAPAPASTTDYICNDSSDVVVMAEIAYVGRGPASCRMKIECPDSSDGACALEVTLTIEGIGLVGARLTAGGSPEACMDLNACTTATRRELAPGKGVRVRCQQTSPSAAASVTMSCRVDLS